MVGEDRSEEFSDLAQCCEIKFPGISSVYEIIRRRESLRLMVGDEYSGTREQMLFALDCKVISSQARRNNIEGSSSCPLRYRCPPEQLQENRDYHTIRGAGGDADVEGEDARNEAHLL